MLLMRSPYLMQHLGPDQTASDRMVNVVGSHLSSVPSVASSLIVPSVCGHDDRAQRK